jgi:hypothetical protein
MTRHRSMPQERASLLPGLGRGGQRPGPRGSADRRRRQAAVHALYDTGQAVPALVSQAQAEGVSVHQMGGFWHPSARHMRTAGYRRACPTPTPTPAPAADKRPIWLALQASHGLWHAPKLTVSPFLSFWPNDRGYLRRPRISDSPVAPLARRAPPAGPRLPPGGRLWCGCGTEVTMDSGATGGNLRPSGQSGKFTQLR